MPTTHGREQEAMRADEHFYRDPFDEDGDDRLTTLDIHYIGEDEREGSEKWFVRQRDGGPFDGRRIFPESDEELAGLIIHFLSKREGLILIRRHPHPHFDELDRQRESERVEAEAQRFGQQLEAWGAGPQ